MQNKLMNCTLILCFLLAASCGGDSGNNTEQKLQTTSSSQTACEKLQDIQNSFRYPGICSNYYGSLHVFSQDLAPTQKCISLMNQIIDGYEKNVCNSDDSNYFANKWNERQDTMKYYEKNLLRYIERNEIQWVKGQNKRFCDQKKKMLTTNEIASLKFNDDCSKARLNLLSFAKPELTISKHRKKDRPEICKHLSTRKLSEDQLSELEESFEYISLRVNIGLLEQELKAFKDSLMPLGIRIVNEDDHEFLMKVNFKYKEEKDLKFFEHFTVSSNIKDDELFYIKDQMSISLWITKYGACKIFDHDLDTQEPGFKAMLEKLIDIKLQRYLMP